MHATTGLLIPELVQVQHRADGLTLMPLNSWLGGLKVSVQFGWSIRLSYACVGAMQILIDTMILAYR